MKTRETPPATAVRIAGWGAEKQLVAASDAVTGALLFAELPIAFVETRADEDDEGPWLLLEMILATPAMADRVAAADLKLTRWPLAADDLETLAHLAGRYRRNPDKLAQLYHRVAANNIRYAQGGRHGYGIWPTLSRSNHSCAPNCQPGALADRPLVELLLATRPIAVGEPLCWNYYGDPAFLALSCAERNARLQRDFRFQCRCPRCLRERAGG
jgi:hypothetical protein